MAVKMITFPSREAWLPVKGFEGLYEVSNLGRVKSIKRRGASGGVLKQCMDRYGYMKVVLRKRNKPHYYAVHRLVATAFIDNPDKKTTVDHIDCNRANNCVTNLRWASMAENLMHSHDLGRQGWNAKPIIATNQAGEIFEFDSQHEAARCTGVKQYTISRVLHGKNHNAKGWRFEYGSHESAG